MADKEKAIRILEGNYKNFVLRHNGELLTVNELIALLKAQEPIAPIQGADDQDEDIFCCGCCGAVVGETFLGPPGECEMRDNYCPECGRRVKWE